MMDLNLDKLKLSEYDYTYLPESTEIVKITVNKWQSLSAEHIPSWVGFGEDKSYELSQIGENTGYQNTISISGLFSITKVFKINNPYLERSFELKKSKKSRLGSVCHELIVYHATLPCNVDSINVNNFNWRLFGQSRGHKHGQGVSFSPHPKFANRFCKARNDKIMIQTKILYQSIQEGFQHHKLPSIGYDTTRSRNGNVFVKFEDSEFLPLYVIHYNY